MRVLFLTTMLPGLKRTGSEVASQAFVDALRRTGADVTVLGYRRAGDEPPLAPGDVAVADRHIETDAAGLRPAIWMGRAVAARLPYTLAKYVSGAYRRAAEDRLGGGTNLVVLDHAQVGWLRPAGGWRAPVIFIAHNVEHLLHTADHGRGPRAWAHRRELRRLRPVELGLAVSAAETWTLTRADAHYFDQQAGGARTRVFDLPGTGATPPTEHASRDVVVLGSWHWQPNAQGLSWMAERVAPRLAEQGIEVTVGGARGAEVVNGAAGMHAVGRVPDAMDFLRSARVVAVPSVAGAGVQVRALDAIASGRWVVATSIAMRGIEDPPATVTTVDDPADFAGEIVRLAGREPDRDTTRDALSWTAARAQRFNAEVGAAAAAAARA